MSKMKQNAGHSGLSVISGAWKLKIGRIMVSRQQGQKVCEIQTNQ
jgi:hypothetical protein